MNETPRPAQTYSHTSPGGAHAVHGREGLGFIGASQEGSGDNPPLARGGSPLRSQGSGVRPGRLTAVGLMVVALLAGGAWWAARAGPPQVTPDRKSTRLNSSHSQQSRMPSSA